jgi:hypothetical protein
MKELMEIEKNIDKLKKETNIGSIEEIVKAFKEYEDTNANLSKHVSDLNADVKYYLIEYFSWKKLKSRLRILKER